MTTGSGYVISHDANSDKPFVPCPDGEQLGVCCDIVDLGMSNYQGKLSHKVRLVFESEELMAPNEEGEAIPFTVGQRFTVSLHKDSSLRAFLEKWRGKPFEQEEIKKFDLESILGKCARINVSHNADLKDSDKIFANVDSALPLKKGQVKLEVSTSYTRKKDREDWVAPPDSPWTRAAARSRPRQTEQREHPPQGGRPTRSSADYRPQEPSRAAAAPQNRPAPQQRETQRIERSQQGVAPKELFSDAPREPGADEDEQVPF